jgi:hypothetical protein
MPCANYQDGNMTGEESPAAKAVARPAQAPDLRASHADRDQVAEILRVAAGDGRLTADELDERIEAALSARTVSDLATLTADLPAAAPGQLSAEPKELIRIDQRFGDVTRVGRWVVPKRIEIKLTAGNVKLDFTDAVITQGILHIDVDLGLGGDLLLITKPGVVVVTDDLTVRMGDIKVRHRDDPGTPVILRVEVAGRVRGGDIVARLPRRTFRQWVRRENSR